MAVPLFVLENEKKRVYRHRKLLEDYTDTEIKRHTGLPFWGLREVIGVFSPLEGPTKSSLPIETKVLTFLSHLRSGSFQYMLGSSNGVGQSTVCKIINEFVDYSLQLAPHVIKFPDDLQSLNAVKQGFAEIDDFPNIIGLIDGTQVPIKAPKDREEVYVCRKQFHAINTQVICGPDLSFFDVVAKWPGCTHDAFIWSECGAKERIESGELGDGWLLGDSGYPLEERLLPPYLTERSAAERKFNEKHKTTRCAVERSIGVWKSRFRCLDRTGGSLCYDEKKCCKIIIAAAVLHNICVRKEVPLTEEDQRLCDSFVRERLVEADLEPNPPPSRTTQRKRAAELRNNIAASFQ